MRESRVYPVASQQMKATEMPAYIYPKEVFTFMGVNWPFSKMLTVQRGKTAHWMDNYESLPSYPRDSVTLSVTRQTEN